MFGVAWVLQNERGGGYWHPDSPQGVTLNRAERAYEFEERDEAEQVADRLNGTMIRGSEAVFNDEWVVIEGSGRSWDEASSWLVLATEKADQRVPA